MSDPVDCVLLIDGDLLAASTLRPRPQHVTLNDAQAAPDRVEAPQALLARLENEVLPGRRVNFRVKACYFTAVDRDAPELAAHKANVKAAMKRAGVQCETLDNEHAVAADAAIAVRLMRVLWRQPSVAHAVVVSHSADIVPALAAAQDEGKTTTVCTLNGVPVAAMDDFRAVTSAFVALQPGDLFGLPFFPAPKPVKLYRAGGGGGFVDPVTSQPQQQPATTRANSTTPPASQHQPVMPVVPQPPLQQQASPAQTQAQPDRIADVEPVVDMDAARLQRGGGGGGSRPPTDQMDPNQELSNPAATATGNSGRAPSAGPSAAGGAQPPQPQPQQSSQPQSPQQPQQPQSQPQPQRQPSPAPSASSQQSQPRGDRPEFDMPLPAGVEVHWSPQYREWYYTVRKDGGAPETTWLFPGPREKQLQLKIKVLEWKATHFPAERASFEQQLATLRTHLQNHQQQQQGGGTSSAPPAQQGSPMEKPKVVATYNAVPPNATNTAPQPQYQQQPPQQQQQSQPHQQQQQHPYAYTQPPQQQPQQQQPPQSYNYQGAPSQQQQPPQQPQQQPQQQYPQQQPMQQQQAPQQPQPHRVPDQSLPPGWEKWFDPATRREFYVDRNVNPPRRVDQRPPF